MKNFCLCALILGAQICAPVSSRAMVDVNIGAYPFADVCAYDIDEYCNDYERDVGSCMFEHYDYLDDDCGEAVYFWGGDRFGWDGDWRGIPRAERADYLRNMRERQNDYTGKFEGPAPMHNEFRGGEGFHGGGHMGGGRR